MSNVDLIDIIKKHPYSFCVDVSELNGTARDVLEGMLAYLDKLEQTDSYRSQLLEMGFDQQMLNGMDYEDLRDAFNEMNSAWYDCFDESDLEDDYEVNLGGCYGCHHRGLVPPSSMIHTSTTMNTSERKADTAQMVAGSPAESFWSVSMR